MQMKSVNKLRACLDAPAHHGVAGRLTFSGWVCHPETPIEAVSLRIGQQRLECDFPKPSPDVAAHYPGWPGCQACRFEIAADVPPLSAFVLLVARLKDGSILSFRFPGKYAFHGTVHGGRSYRARAKRTWSFVHFSARSAREWIARRGRLPRLSEIRILANKALAQFRSFSLSAETPPDAPPGFALPDIAEPYAAWCEINRYGRRSGGLAEARLARTPGRPPLISVVLPVYRPPLRYLEMAVDSVIDQTYPNWELCIADDASEDEKIVAYLKGLAARDARVKARFLAENLNISAATNAAAELARGEFLLFLDNDDLLAPNALTEAALYLTDHPDTDYLYSDDDKVDVDGKRFSPQFKPDWSPELLLSYMYCAHMIVVRRSLFETLGGMRAGFEGSQDYDFALRATEVARGVGHIPKVLYHWRVLPGSTAASGDAKPAAFEAGRRAVFEALQRRGLTGVEVYRPDWAVRSNVGIYWHDFPDDGPTVAILIPTRNQASLLRTCLKSIGKTTYRNYEVVVLDNLSDAPDALRLLDECGHRVLRIANPGSSFSFAHINNVAARQVGADYLLFLNNDTEVIEPRWLSRMVGIARLRGVGAVGARLLYGDRRIQHAGIVHGFYNGMAGPAFKLLGAEDGGYLSYAKVTRNYLAVTAACMLTPRQAFLDHGGFDEPRFAVAYNDVDYCYRLADSGLRSVYVPGAELYHHEGLSRGFQDDPRELANFRQRHGRRRDPYFSPHLSLENERFEISVRRYEPAQDAPIRTLMVAYNLNLEGAPYSQYELTASLKRQGVVDPVVYCPSEGPLRALYEKAGIEVDVFEHPLAGVFGIEAYRKAIDGFARYLQARNVQMVYANTLQTFYAIAAAREARLPSLWNPRESEPWQTYFNHFGAEIAAQALACFQYPYRVVFVSAATRNGCRPLETRRNFTVIRNALDMARLGEEAMRWGREKARRHLDLAEADVMVLLLGTVCERKGQHDLALALAQVPDALHGRTACCIVGDRDSAYSRELHRHVAALPESLRRRVRIVPETHDTALYYSAADVFVCASRIESYPRVVLEAMAYSLPIVTTPVFGIPEQVRENVNACYFGPGDIQKLAGHLRVLIEDDALRSHMASASAQVLASGTSHADMVSAYAELFREAYFSGDAIDGIPGETPQSCAA